MVNKLAIVLCIKDGEIFLEEQLRSIENQSFKKFDLFLSDDSENKSSNAIIEKFKKDTKIDNIFISQGPKVGFAKNFISTICKIIDRYDFYAFSDQDDIWEKEKIDHAIKILNSLEENVPNLYCSRTKYINTKGDLIGMSPLFKKKPSFENALVQSLAGGNTMVFNNKAASILKHIDQDLEIISHDWLLYQLVSGAHGNIYYDEEPKILYRQHSKNIIGSNKKISGQLKRAFQMLNGEYKDWINSNLDHLLDNPWVKKESKKTIEAFKMIRSKNIFKRIYGLYKTKIYRQTMVGNFSLILVTVLRKLT